MDLSSQLVLTFLALLIAATAFWLFLYPEIRRRRLDRKSFPESWLQILDEQLPFHRKLSPEEQQKLQRLIIRFLDAKRFIGCAGQEIDDRVRLTIASQACLLLLNRTAYEYPGVTTVLVYPSVFVAQHHEIDENGVVHCDPRVLAGESWETGKVVLAWDNVESGARDFSDGHNVVLHEFAHQLDQESGASNGSPLLDSRAAYAGWARTFAEEFIRLQQNTGTGLLDDYGASNPAEFFAVVTETYFEQPHALAEHHPALFHELLKYYRTDPRRWHEVNP